MYYINWFFLYRANYRPIVYRSHQEYINCIIDSNMLGYSSYMLYPNYITTLNNCNKILKNCAFKLFNKLL